MSGKRHMPNTFRHMLFFPVPLLCLLLICVGGTAVHAEEGNKRKQAPMPEAVDLFVPSRTIVEAQGQNQTRDSFAFPSLATAGGVLVAVGEGRTDYTSPHHEDVSAYYNDIVAGYIDPAESWSSFVAKVRANEWRAHSIFNMTTQEEHEVSVRYAPRPTAIAKGDKVFLLVGGYYQKYDPSSKRWVKSSQGFDLLVGEATQDKVIQWGEPTPLLPQIEPSAKQLGLQEFIVGGGSGVVMEDGTLVFPLRANTGGSDFVCMIIYSKDDGKNWVLAQRMVSGRCIAPLIVEWEQGQLLMVAKCNSGSKVFESRDMGATWTEAVRTLTRVQPMLLPNTLRTAEGVGSLTTASIAGKKVMLYTQKGVPPGGSLQATALYLWVTDNNRTFQVGPISMDTTGEITSSNTLLY
ncbi:trans-sialidase, partial [Trypanosoma rangeli SC58]